MLNQIIHGDCFDILRDIPDKSIDAVITDPPYKYLDHRLETDWDEKLFFEHCFRVLKDNGMLCFFGAKESYFRWNVIALDLGFKFKEQIIWDKVNTSNPMCALPRSHENISIFTKGNGIIRTVKIDKLEYDSISNHKNIVNDVKRIISTLKNINSWDEFLLFRKGELNKTRLTTSEVTIKGGKYNFDRGCATYKSLANGRKFPSIFRCNRENYYKHPTQKPLLLIYKLVEMLTPEGGTVLDPFCGSGTTALACKELGRNYICIEKELDYYNIACNRINQNIKLETELNVEERVEDQQLSLF